MSIVCFTKLFVMGVPITSEILKKEYILPVCGESSTVVLNHIRYQWFCICTFSDVYTSLVKYDKDLIPYIRYNDYGLRIKFKLRFSNNFLELDMVEYQNDEPKPP